MSPSVFAVYIDTLIAESKNSVDATQLGRFWRVHCIMLMTQLSWPPLMMIYRYVKRLLIFILYVLMGTKLICFVQ